MNYSVSYADFVADPLRLDVYLIDASPILISTGLVQEVRYSTDAYITAPTDTPAYYSYAPQAIVALNVEQSLVQPGTVATTSGVTGGELRVGHIFGDGDVLRTDYDWSGAALTVIHVGYSPANDGWVSRANGRVLYNGEVESIQAGLSETVFVLRTPGARLSEPIQTSGILGSPWMLYFDGSATQVKTTGPEPKLALQGTATFEFRLYVEALPVSSAYLVGYYGGTTYPWKVTLNSAGKIVFADSATTHYTTTAALTVKKWYHVSIAINATSTIVRIVDQLTGVKTTETDATDNTGRPAASGSPGFAIGCAGAASFFNGFIHHVRVWSVKRTEAELDASRWLRLSAADEANDDLKGLWRGEDGTTEDGTDDRMGDASQIVTTQDTISAVAAGNKFTRAAGSFVTDGWVAGMRGLSSAFGTVGNNGLWTVSTVDATNLAITGLTLTNEADVVAALLQSAPLEIVDAGGIEWVQALEGQPDMSGTLRPLAYGRCESIPGVLVSQSRPTYLLAGHKIQSVDAVYVGGVGPQDPTTGIVLDAAYTDLVTFLRAATDPSKYDTLIYDGGAYVRLGSAANFPVTIDIKGDASGSGYVETAGQIVRRIITTRGTDPFADPSELDTASFDALDTANSAPCGVYAFGSEPVSAVAAVPLASVGAAGFLARATGKFTVNRFGGVTGSPVVAIDERHIVSIEPEPVDPPIYAVVVRYRRQYRVLTLEEIAGTVLQQDDPIVGRLTNEYLTVRRENPAVLDRFPRAGTLTVDTTLAVEGDAIAEADRLLPLYAGEATAYKVRVSEHQVRDVLEGDVVETTIKELDHDGSEIARLGLVAGDSSSYFLVMMYAPVIEEESAPLVEMTLWKGGS